MEGLTSIKILKSVALKFRRISMQQHQKFLQTEGKIKDAVVQLIREKGLVNITVSDIVSQAKINRTTFYRHYLDKHDLI